MVMELKPLIDKVSRTLSRDEILEAHAKDTSNPINTFMSLSFYSQELGRAGLQDPVDTLCVSRVTTPHLQNFSNLKHQRFEPSPITVYF